MTTISVGRKDSFNLRAGHQVSITALGGARVSRIRGGGEVEGDWLDAAETKTFGPYYFDYAIEISAISGDVVYSVSEAAGYDSAAEELASATGLTQEQVTSRITERDNIAVLCGDSILAGGNAIVSGVTVSVSAGIATVTNATSHGLAVGGSFYLSGSTETGAWGEFQVATRTDANGFTFAVPSDYPSTVSGASITVINYQRLNDRNWPAVANAMIDSPLKSVINRCAPGMRTDQVLERYEDDVLTLNPAVIFMCIGVNDCLQGIDESVIKTNIATMVSGAVNRGIKVAITTLPPVGPSATGYTTTIAYKVMRINRWLREYTQQFEYVRVIDLFGAVCDNVADWLSGYSSDDLHPNGRAAKEVADITSPILQTWFPGGVKHATALYDRYATDSSSRQLNSNPIMNGTGGTESGGATGDTADTYTLSKTGTLSAAGSKETRTDNRGYNQIITVTGAINGDVCDLIGTSQHAIVTAGDRLKMWAHVSGATITGFANLRAYIEIVIGGVTYTLDAISSSGGTYAVNDDFDYYLQTPEFLVPSGSITICRPRVQFNFGGAGGGVFKVGCLTMEKIEI